MLGEIYRQECQKNNVQEEQNLFDDTIFNTMTERFRNTSAHFNAFYDDKINKIVFLNGEKMSIAKFVSLYERLFLFMYKWMDLYLESGSEEAFVTKLKDELTKMLDASLKLMQQIERNGNHIYWEPVIWNRWGSKLIEFRENEAKKNMLPPPKS